jgi:type IV pilus assembly protein PilB
MDDPTNEAAIDEVARTASLAVKPMIACPSDIRAAIRVYYLGEVAPPPVALAPAPPPSAPSSPGTLSSPPSPFAGARPQPVESSGPRSSAAGPPADAPRPGRKDAKVLEAVPRPPRKTPEPDSADAAPEIEATEREVIAPPKRARARMISLTLLDGTTISIPAGGSGRKSRPEIDPQAREELSEQLTARDLVSALRAVAHGADASEILGTEPRWEAMFSALLSILLRKGLIADWEFVEEFRKV